MSNLIHCDNPDCENTRDSSRERRLHERPWLEVQQAGQRLDFCSLDCMRRWAGPEKTSVPSPRTVTGL